MPPDPASPTPWPLPPDEVHVWAASRADPTDFEVERQRALLTPDEIKRADRFVNPLDRRRFAVARGTLRSILAGYLGEPAGAIRFAVNPHGKPSVDPNPLDLRFNVSHSGDLLLFALSLGREVGVDVERVRPDFDAEPLARRFFAADEVAALDSLRSADDRLLAFFRGWARKEAYIKAQGKGLALPLDEFAVEIRPDRPCSLLSTDHDPPEAGRWTLVELATEPGYAAALCVRGFGWTLRSRPWPLA